MKKFISKVLLLFTGIIAISLLILWIVFFIMPPQFSFLYNASFTDKVERLKSINESKIILVGDSNVAFGFNSEMIEKEFNMPVVNLGLHGGLPNEILENMAKINIQNGDIVIVSHSIYVDNQITDYTLLWTTMESNLKHFDIVDKKHYYGLVKALPQFVSKKIRRFIKGQGKLIDEKGYSVTSFNEYGDFVFPRKESRFTFDEYSINIPYIGDETIKRLNELNDFCKEKGATLLISSYPIADGEYTPDKKYYEEFQKKMKDNLKCRIISDYKDYLFDYKYFYDTKLHLTDEGAILRTKQLIKDIKNWEK